MPTRPPKVHLAGNDGTGHTNNCSDSVSALSLLAPFHKDMARVLEKYRVEITAVNTDYGSQDRSITPIFFSASRVTGPDELCVVKNRASESCAVREPWIWRLSIVALAIFLTWLCV